MACIIYDARNTKRIRNKLLKFVNEDSCVWCVVVTVMNTMVYGCCVGETVNLENVKNFS